MARLILRQTCRGGSLPGPGWSATNRRHGIESRSATMHPFPCRRLAESAAVIWIESLGFLHAGTARRCRLAARGLMRWKFCRFAVVACVSAEESCQPHSVLPEKNKNESTVFVFVGSRVHSAVRPDRACCRSCDALHTKRVIAGKTLYLTRLRHDLTRLSPANPSRR